MKTKTMRARRQTPEKRIAALISAVERRRVTRQTLAAAQRLVNELGGDKASPTIARALAAWNPARLPSGEQDWQMLDSTVESYRKRGR